MKWIAKALMASVVLPAALHAKGLDKLQPETQTPEEESVDNEGKKTERRSLEPGDKAHKIGDKKEHKEGEVKRKEGAKEAEGESETTEVKAPPAPVEPGFQRWYIGTSLGLIKTSASKGEWNSNSTGDLELGNRVVKQFLGKFDVYGTFRYRPSDVTVEDDLRAYRGVVETYLFGGKGQMELMPKFHALASVEFGIAKVTLKGVDGNPEVDRDLEKSGVDLTIGAGVSYLVLDKIALGTQLHLGLGTYKSTQFGVDLRFLL
jgi:hypothetical protein